MVCDPLASGLALPVLEASCWPEIVSLGSSLAQLGLELCPMSCRWSWGSVPQWSVLLQSQKKSGTAMWVLRVACSMFLS